MWDDDSTLAQEGRTWAPEGFRTVDLRGAAFLAGPTGAFLVVEGGGPQALELLAVRTDQVRLVLSRHLQWVPFLHPVVLSDTPQLVPRAVTLSQQQLRERLVDGRPSIEPETLAKIDEIVERRILHIDALVEPSGRSSMGAGPTA